MFVSKMNLKNSFTIALIAGIIFLIAANGRIGTVTIDTAIGYGVLFFALLFLYYTGKDYLRELSPKVIWNGGYDTTNGDFISAGYFGILRLGAIDAWEIETKGGENGILIAPHMSFYNRNKYIACSANCEPCELHELPPEVIKVIEKLKLKPPYHFGLIDAERFTDVLSIESDARKPYDVTVAHLISAIKRKYTENRILSLVWNERFEHYEKLMEKLRVLEERKPVFKQMVEAK